MARTSRVDRLSRALRAEHPHARAEALTHVTNSSMGDLTPQVVELLTDRHSDVRYEAAHALGRVLAESGKAPAKLLRAMSDRDELVRVAASEAVGDIGDKGAAPQLQRRLIDPSPLVRSFAASALGLLGLQSARAALAKASRRERSAIARVGLYEALFRLGDQSSLQRLLALLQSKQYRVRCAVANTVADLPLDSESRGEVRRVLREALAAEETVAATSSIEFALRQLRRRPRHAR